MDIQQLGRRIATMLALVGISSIAIASLVATGLMPTQAAQATPNVTPALGLGEQQVGATATNDSSQAKAMLFADLGEEIGERLDGSPTKKPTPIVKPKPAPRARTSSSSASRGSVSGSGWQSARCSWYGPGFYGNTMAGGGKLTTSSMVVAHRSLSFGTRIQFEYKGRTCTAVVQDRGPYIGGRIFDLGPGTAKALGFSGVGTVRYRILGR